MKKTLNIVKTVFVWAFVVFTIGMMIFTIISVTTFDQNNRDLFGYKAFIVRSDSMSATHFSAGDLILVKEVDPSTIQDGDVITFISQNTGSFGETVTHKVRKVTTNEKGQKGFITYGTTTGTDDETVVTYPYVLGKYVTSLPGVGEFFRFIKTGPGYVSCILIPALLLIGYQAVNCIRLFRKQKQEQMAAIQAERDEIAEERRKTEEMMRELQALKAQMERAAEKPEE